MSRTVGWFTSEYPLAVEVAPESKPLDTLQAVREFRRSVPDGGIGYGLLRYLSSRGAALRNLPHAEIGFNYLGQLDRGIETGNVLRIAKEDRGAERNAGGGCDHLLDINGGVLAGRLRMEWLFSDDVFSIETIRAVAEDFLAGVAPADCTW